MTRTFLVIDIQNDYFPVAPCPCGKRRRPRRASWRPSAGRGHPGTDRPRAACLGGGDGAVCGRGARHRHPPAIRAAAGDAPVVTKRHADAFQETGLADLLVGTDTLLIGGMMTQNCVVFTALSRAGDAFRVRVIGDLCTAPGEVVHRIALSALRAKGLVAGADETGW